LTGSFAGRAPPAGSRGLTPIPPAGGSLLPLAGFWERCREKLAERWVFLEGSTDGPRTPKPTGGIHTEVGNPTESEARAGTRDGCTSGRARRAAEQPSTT